MKGPGELAKAAGREGSGNRGYVIKFGPLKQQSLKLELGIITETSNEVSDNLTELP